MRDILPVPFGLDFSDDLTGLVYMPGLFTMIISFALVGISFFICRKMKGKIYLMFIVVVACIFLWTGSLYFSDFTARFTYIIGSCYNYWARKIFPLDWYLFVLLYLALVVEWSIRRFPKCYYFTIVVGLILIVLYGLYASTVSILVLL